MNNVERFAYAWVLCWGLMYIWTAIADPTISGGDAILGTFLYAGFGIFILVGAEFRARGLYKNNKALRKAGSFMLVLATLVEILSAVQSWTGLAIWNVPFSNKEGFQISMSFMDFISSVLMLLLAAGSRYSLNNSEK
jgi:hypothetical protein